MSDSIKVSVRLRDLIEREVKSKSSIHWVSKDFNCVSQINNSSVYAFDRVFSGHENNEAVYSEFCSPIVESVAKGINGTIFAYGQTSSGKTYTLMGNGPSTLGIVQLSVYDLFQHIQNMPDREFLLRVSLMEIYNEKVVDLLAKKSAEKLKLQDDQYGNVKVLNLSELEVQEPDQVLEILKKGQGLRKTGETELNQKSSRSHLIFRMIIESRLCGNETASVNVSHFNLVDLAGSEKPSANVGARFKEGVNINTSLLQLSQVIYQLSTGKEHNFVSYRASKLTRILKNSLGGNALTAIICNITPASFEETLSTLKFALSAKTIKNKPKVNEVETDEALLKKYANKIKELAKELEATKEEKYQETKKRRDMQELIDSLKNKFVSQFVPRNSIQRSSRRETWGGSLDMARMKKMIRPNKSTATYLPDFEEENANFSNWRGSLEVTCARKKSHRSSVFSDIAEENENAAELEDTWSGESFKKLIDAPDTIKEAPKRRVSEKSSPDLKRKDETIEALKERIAYLEKENQEILDSTKLEKQMFIEEHSKSKETGESRNGIESLSSYSPSPRKSASNNLSVSEESFGVINSLVGRKSEACHNLIDMDQDMFFYHVNSILEKLFSVWKIDSVPSTLANPYFKTIYQLFHLTFEKQFMGINKEFSEEIKEVLLLMSKLFVGFSNQGLDYPDTELIDSFGTLSEKLMKSIETFRITSKESSSFNNSTANEPQNLNTRVGTVSDLINISTSKSCDSKMTQTTENYTDLGYTSNETQNLNTLVGTVSELINVSICKSCDSKMTQTVENYPDLEELEKVRAHEYRERLHMCSENDDLKLQVEKLLSKITYLEKDLNSKSIEISEINESQLKELYNINFQLHEKEVYWKSKLRKTIQDIEEKHEAELVDQEKSLFNMMEELRNKYVDEREKEHKEFVNKLKESHLKQVSKLYADYDKLQTDSYANASEERERNHNARLKLIEEIRELKDREEKARLAYYKMKNKLKEYQEEVKIRMRNSTKCVEEKGTQTMPDYFKRSEKETQTRSDKSKDGICKACEVLKHELKSLSAVKSNFNVENKELLKKIAGLKEELRAKEMFLKTCNCRLFAKPEELMKDVKISTETKAANTAMVECDIDKFRKKAADNPKEIINLEVVQKAINEAREEERAKFNRGEGPASQEMCFLLRRKLGKKEKEISELKRMISQKQSATAKHPVSESENVPLHPIDAEIVNVFSTPNKDDNGVAPKNILKKRNKLLNSECRPFLGLMTEEEKKKADEIDHLLNSPVQEQCKQQ